MKQYSTNGLQESVSELQIASRFLVRGPLEQSLLQRRLKSKLIIFKNRQLPSTERNLAHHVLIIRGTVETVLQDLKELVPIISVLNRGATKLLLPQILSVDLYPELKYRLDAKLHISRHTLPGSTEIMWTIKDSILKTYEDLRVIIQAYAVFMRRRASNGQELQELIHYLPEYGTEHRRILHQKPD